MTLLQTEWSSVKKEVNGAVSVDLAGGENGAFLAYKTYLDCLLKIISLLRRDATLITPSVSPAANGVKTNVIPTETVNQRRNFVKLAKQCLDRVNDLAESAQPPDVGGVGESVNFTKNPQSPRQTTKDPLDLSLLLPDVPSDLPLSGSSRNHANPPSATAPKPSAPTFKNSSTPSFHPPGNPPVSRTGSAPIIRGHESSVTSPSSAQRRAVGGSLRHVPNVNVAQNQKATLNMAAFRKMEEERKIAKKTQMRMEQRLKERKKQLEEDALERFADESTSSGVVVDKAKFFASAALVEQDDAVLALIRKKLLAARKEGNFDDEMKFIDALMNKIFIKMPNHPLAELVARHQRSLIGRLQPLITPYIQQLDSIVVPYIDPSASLASNAAVTVASEPSPDEDENSPPKDNSQYVAELEKQNFERQKLDILESEAIERHLDTISKDVRMAVEVIMSKLSLLYGEEMFGEETQAASAARERAYGMIEKIFFKPLWPLLVNMFRLGNKQDEVQLAKIMTINMDLIPEDMGIPPSLCLKEPSTPSHPQLPRRHGFEPVIAELHHLATLSSPLCKLECLVNLCKTVCTCVDQIKLANSSDDVSDAAAAAASAGSLGADDLLPILSFAILHSKMPQLASESRAMSEFIHETYQMGEEGYCLISIQTAIGYLMRLDEEG